MPHQFHCEQQEPKALPIQVWFDTAPHVASIEIGSVLFRLRVGIPMVEEEDGVVLVEKELEDWQVVEEVVAMVMLVRVEDGSEDVSNAIDAGSTEPGEA